MARCSSTGMCECIVTGGQGIRVPGNGSIAQPYTVSSYRSTDAGNCARFGSDGGIYVPCSSGDEADVCGVSVESLAASRVVVGRGGAGRLLAPDHTLRSFTRAVELDLDAVHAYVRPLSDGTPVCYPSSSLTGQTGLTRDPLVGNMAIGGYKTVPLRVGWKVLTPEENQAAANLGQRHGFFGFSEPDQVGGTTLAEVLQTVGKRSVLLFEAIDYTPAMLERMLSLIFRYCAQDSIIVAADTPGDLAEFRNAGIPTMVVVRSEAEALEKPPSTLLDQGVTWVSLARELADATVLGYTTAGLNAMLYMVNRHYEWERVDNLGVRAVLSDDPMYASADPARYRSATLDTPMYYRHVMPGMLSYWTDPRPGEFEDGSIYWPLHSRAFVFPDNDSIYLSAKGPNPSGGDITGVPYRRASGIDEMLTGWLNPIPVPDNYVFEFDSSFRNTPGEPNRNMGLIFGKPDDRAVEDYREVAGHEYWTAALRWDGTIFLNRVVDGAIVDQASTGTGAVTEDRWNSFRLTVTPQSVTFARTDVQTPGEVTVEQSLTRGPYSHIFKNELFQDSWYPYGGAWANFKITLNQPQGGQEAPQEGVAG